MTDTIRVIVFRPEDAPELPFEAITEAARRDAEDKAATRGLTITSVRHIDTRHPQFDEVDDDGNPLPRQTAHIFEAVTN